jgi:hypothetical protein
MHQAGITPTFGDKRDLTRAAMPDKKRSKMKRPFSIHEDWGAEHGSKPWEKVETKEKRCPMCGALECGGHHDAGKDYAAGQIMMRLAQINLESPVVLQVLLRRIINLAGGRHTSLEDVAEQVIDARTQQATMTRQAVYESCKAACAMWPTLKPYLNPDA